MELKQLHVHVAEKVTHKDTHGATSPTVSMKMDSEGHQKRL